MKQIPTESTHQKTHIDSLYKDLSILIEKSKQKVIIQVKSAVNLLYWQIGKRINDEILYNKRANYGKKQSQILLLYYLSNMDAVLKKKTCEGCCNLQSVSQSKANA